MEYTNPWAPVVQLQNQGDYEQAWEKMKQMPEFQAKLENNPEMQRNVLVSILDHNRPTFRELFLIKNHFQLNSTFHKLILKKLCRLERIW